MTIDGLKNSLGNELHNHVFIFDMDGTLVNTDIANRMAYQQAAKNVCQCSLYNVVGRMTRQSLKYSRLSPEKESLIVEEKQRIYPNYLDKTLLLPAGKLLKDLHDEGCTTILATQADRQRALQTLKYHHLEDCFTYQYFQEDFGTDKYQYIQSTHGFDPDYVYIFEDSDAEVEEAVNAGFQRQHIVSLLRPFTIFKSKPYDLTTGFHLTKGHVQAFYHMDYLRGKWTFINTLKAENGETDERLEGTSHILSMILLEDLPLIYHLLGDKELVICGIPRSKAKSSYADRQLLFNSTISKVVQALGTDYKIIDGGEYIIRHTDTPTTHLMHKDGEHVVVPVGITKESCTISPEVKGKDILLIDDIYTASVNIDEDAIQALYDNGAHSVTFYSIARTKRLK